MELNDLYDHLWNLGTVLQGDRNSKPNPTSNTNPNWLSLKVKKLFLFSTTTIGHGLVYDILRVQVEIITSNEVDYLTALVTLMMKADARRGAIDQAPVQLSGTSPTCDSIPIRNPQRNPTT